MTTNDDGSKRSVVGRALGGFFGSTLMTTIAGAIVIPILIHAVGASAWASIAVAQAVGAVGAIIINLGWGVSGPAEIGSLDDSERAEYYRNSVVVRATVAIPVAVACYFVAGAQHHDLGGALGMIAVGASLAGLGGQWYFYGTSAPKPLFVLDTLPRTLLSLVGALLAVPTGSVTLFALAQLLSAVVPVILTTNALVGLKVWVRNGPSTGHSGVGNQLYGTLTALFGSAYLTLPVVVLSYSAPGAVVAFALADRLARIARLVISPMTQTLQGWVAGARDAAVRRSRDRRGLITAMLWGLLVASVYASLAYVVGLILSAGKIQLPLGLVVFTAITLLMTAVSQTTGTIGLVLSGRRRWLAGSAFVGAAISLPMLLVLPPVFGSSGGALAIVLGEAGVLVVQGLGLAAGRRTR